MLWGSEKPEVDRHPPAPVPSSSSTPRCSTDFSVSQASAGETFHTKHTRFQIVPGPLENRSQGHPERCPHSFTLEKLTRVFCGLRRWMRRPLESEKHNRSRPPGVVCHSACASECADVSRTDQCQMMGM